MKRFSNYLLALLMATLATASPALAQKVTVIGSDTMAQLNQKWAQEFMKAYPNIKVEVSGGGSGVGIAALRNGTTDVAAASRLIKSKETQDFLVGLNVKPVQHEVALDGVVIFVNEKNPVETLSLTQIEKIYRGEITNWKELGGIDLPIVLYGREANSGTYGFVKEVVLKEKDFSSKVQTLAGTAAVYDAVGKDTSGIGYGGIGYAHGVRELKVKLDDKPETIGIAPTLDNVAKGVYPLSRPLLYYTTPNNTNTNTDIYVSWVRSTQGQKLVEVVGFVPLPAAKLVAAPTPAAPAASESRFTTSVPKAPAHPQLPSGGTTAIVSVPTAPSRTNSPSAATTGTPSTTPVSAPQPASTPAAVPTPAPVQPTATAATPTEAATEAKTTDLPISTIIPSGPLTSEQLSQIRSALVEREKQVARREMDVAEREDSVAQREISVGKRENAFVPKRYNRR
ncbi:MAG TPA: phosphate ABC transporter substrate-binding protein PstS family protein [Candidatus Methylacidiphilales bacterium]|nr:phosphate ABC transporter substrate-binding protein PstS family protein [Candidatus Methylacidiphilales bacterium]